ncbi:MAG TPA: hypothetical protein VFD91_00290 [Mariniphaga sp.]|nr:hypothetical protein [Mariniphaga sp.]
MELIIIIGLAVALVAIGFLGMAVQIIFKKGGKFPNTHVGGNPYLQKQGISCAKTQDRFEQAQINQQIDFRNIKIVGVDKGNIQL